MDIFYKIFQIKGRIVILVIFFPLCIYHFNTVQIFPFLFSVCNFSNKSLLYF